jgi:hypothetical protein
VLKAAVMQDDEKILLQSAAGRAPGHFGRARQVGC